MSNKITIELSNLTPKQAFELGMMLSDATRTTAETMLAKESSVITRTPRGKGRTSKRFKFNTKVDDHVIEEAVAKRRSGMKLDDLAKYMDSQGETGPRGKPFNSQSIWDVVYSKQAWKYWQI
jgi:hypothetical protein